MSERIFLTYTNATAMPYLGTPRALHVVVNYIDSNGIQYTLQGVPEHGFEHNLEKAGAFLHEEGRSSGAENQDLPFGRLKALRGTAADGTLDGPMTVIAEGGNLRSQWNRMLDFSNRVNSTGYEYRPYSQNSNSFAAGALKHAGLFGPGTATPEIFDRLMTVEPSTGETSSVSVPGFDRRLENPINAFDNRFGSWTSSRAGSAPRDPRQPSEFETSAPMVPFAPTNDVLSPGPPASFNDRFGNWTSLPPVAAPPSSQPQRDNATEIEPRDIRVLSRFTRAPDGSLVPAPLGVPNRP
jgi:hypothetical protein